MEKRDNEIFTWQSISRDTGQAAAQSSSIADHWKDKL